MSFPRNTDPVKLLASVISAEESRISEVIGKMFEAFGQADYISAFMPFDYTDYYTEEMGSGLKRRMVSFESLVPPDGLSEIKRFTNTIETTSSRHGKRLVNIDPGYISSGHLLLATGKPYAHRPFLRDGVYGDLTLIYRDMSF
ncbi:MAG: DUF4416 family protein, partial [Syntrophales bacterium]|nr:DUF4416 family protein [Syntrophales bacterium]